MSDKTIDIRMKETFTFEGGKRWPEGQEMRATRAELKDRGVPESAYEVIDQASGLRPAVNPEQKPESQAATPPRANTPPAGKPGDDGKK